jgi:pantothenate kinase
MIIDERSISNNIGQIAYLNAQQHGLKRIYFGGGFIRGMLSYQPNSAVHL